MAGFPHRKGGRGAGSTLARTNDHVRYPSQTSRRGLAGRCADPIPLRGVLRRQCEQHGRKQHRSDNPDPRRRHRGAERVVRPDRGRRQACGGDRHHRHESAAGNDERRLTLRRRFALRRLFPPVLRRPRNSHAQDPAAAAAAARRGAWVRLHRRSRRHHRHQQPRHRWRHFDQGASASPSRRTRPKRWSPS